MLKNNRHAGIEKCSQYRVRKLQSIDIRLGKSHLRHIGDRNSPASCSIRQGTLGMDITDNGKVILKVVSGRDGTHNLSSWIKGRGLGSLSPTVGGIKAITNSTGSNA